jgi:hypothetical protein
MPASPPARTPPLAQPEAQAPQAAEVDRPPSVEASVRPAIRRPTSHRHPLPPSGRMLALCAWATGIGALGLAVALRGLDAILAHTGPTWYEPTLAGVGLAGVTLTGAAFLSAERMRLPWVMLGLATVPVVVNLGLTIGAL